MSKVSIVTLGCKLNYAESSTWERQLADAGWEAVAWNEGAVDWYVVNSCSVTEHSDKKSRNIVRKLHKICPEAGIVVAGCSAQLRRPSYEGIEGVAKVFGANEKSSLVPWMLERGKSKEEPFFRAYSSGERTRSFLKVQDGCNFKCAYCTVPYARGESRNAPIADIIEDARSIAAKGIKEIVLTGVNTGDFGRSTGESFLELIRQLDKVPGIERYRISSIEPNLLTEECVDFIASVSKFLPHFHFPLQSGCDRILQAMGRRYTTAEFAAKIAYIRKAMEKPGRQEVFFGIDVIAGFPGETPELFDSTVNFLRDVVRPAFIHIFPYSRRPGTPAATMPGQVQESEKTRRVKVLEELSESLHTSFLERNKGLTSKVLIEQKDAGGMASGWSENYIRVSLPWQEGIVNQIIEVKL